MTSHKLCLMDEQNKSLDWPLQDWTISCNQESHRQINQSWKSLLVGSCCSTSSWWETLHHTPADKQSNSQTEWTLDASCSLLTTETELTCRTAEKRKRQPECNEIYQIFCNHTRKIHNSNICIQSWSKFPSWLSDHDQLTERLHDVWLHHCHSLMMIQFF